MDTRFEDEQEKTDPARRSAVRFHRALPGMPTSFLIDSRGLVRARRDGFRDEDEPAIEAEVRFCE